MKRNQADGKVFWAGAGMGWWAEAVAEESVTFHNSRGRPVEGRGKKVLHKGSASAKTPEGASLGARQGDQTRMAAGVCARCRDRNRRSLQGKSYLAMGEERGIHSGSAGSKGECAADVADGRGPKRTR